MQVKNGNAEPAEYTHLVSAKSAFVTLMVAQIIIGYEWLTSGVTKIASGNFVSGLADSLKGANPGTPRWYTSFIHGTVIPHSHIFALSIEVGEVFVGVTFIAAAIIWVTRWKRLPDMVRGVILVLVFLSAFSGVLMALNFHLAMGANHPWNIPKDGFDETIDLDTVMIFLQLALMAFSACLLCKLRKARKATKLSQGNEADVAIGALLAKGS